MRRILTVSVILFWLLLGCRAATIPLGLDPPALSTPTVLLSPEPSPTAAASLLSPAGYLVRLHPDGAIYVGDWLSIEVVAPDFQAVQRQPVTVSLESSPPLVLGSGEFLPYGIGGRSQATFLWALDTGSLAAGIYTLTFQVGPELEPWSVPFSLLPAADLPDAEEQAAWQTARSECCALNYVSGTEVERDLPALLADLDRYAAGAEARLQTQLTSPITITLLPRVLGHGGFAGGEISVSYLDRNYAANQPGMVIHHEMVHILDERLGGEYRPSLLVEGLAVYLSGGHFKSEPLSLRAAALLKDVPALPGGGLDRYIPLADLADDFYAAQHEIGYLEAAALIEYMVQRWGWESYSEFYRHIPSQPVPSAALDQALRQHFDLSLRALEADFIEFLRQQPTSLAWREDLRLTIAFYDTLRRYQQHLDPSAYFRSAWLLDANEMRRRDITADYSRRPETDLNLTLELLLTSAGAAWQAGQTETAAAQLRTINRMLDAYAAGSDPFVVDAAAFDVWVLLQHARSLQDWAGPQAAIQYPVYEPQRLQLDGDSATLWLRAPDGGLLEQQYSRLEGGWLGLLR